MVPKYSDLIVYTILSSHLGGQYTCRSFCGRNTSQVFTEIICIAACS